MVGKIVEPGSRGYDLYFVPWIEPFDFGARRDTFIQLAIHNGEHELSYIKHEVEGRYTMRDFLRDDLEHELKLQEMLRKTINRAHQLGDFGTVEVLEEVLTDREDLGYHLYSVLEDDTLNRGMTHLFDGRHDITGDRPMDPNSRLQ